MAITELVDVNACKKSLSVELPAEEAQKEFDQISREFARRARVPGFRPGKTPLSIVKKRFSSEIREQMIHDIIPRLYGEALEERKIKPISEPHLDDVEFAEGSPLKFKATFEILPAIHLDGYKELRLPAAPGDVSDEALQKGLESIQEQHAKFIPIEGRASRLGDFVTVNLSGRIADASGIQFQDKNVIIHLGDADTVAGFTENLSAVLAGDKRTFTIQYAGDFRNPRLAGKSAEYEAEVVAVKEKSLPPIDDELAREAGEFAGLEELREAVARRLHEDASREHEAKVRDELLSQVLARNTFDVPDVLVEEELRRIFERLAEQLSGQGVDVTRAKIDWKAVAEENRPRALEHARQKLALDAIVDQESLQMSDEELEVEIRRLADLSQKTPDAMRATLAKDDRLEPFRQSLLRRKALELIRNHATA